MCRCQVQERGKMCSSASHEKCATQQNVDEIDVLSHAWYRTFVMKNVEQN